MRALVRTMIIRDRRGYEVRDFGEAKDGTTILSSPPSGIHIVGRSGQNERQHITSAQNLRLWSKAYKLDTAEDLAAFMSQWSQLSRWLGDKGDQPYDEAFMLLEPHLATLRNLAGYVEAHDKTGFGRILRDHLLVERANIVIDVNDPDLPLIIEAPSLLRFMLLEMWSEFGGERTAQWGIRNCRHCDRVFHVGGRRGTKSRRADAHYCSESCKNMASRSRLPKSGAVTRLR